MTSIKGLPTVSAVAEVLLPKLDVASAALAAWFDLHPNKDPLAPVWVDTHLRTCLPNQPLSYDWAHEILRTLAKRAQIEKPIRPHLLRHSLATYYASQLTEAVRWSSDFGPLFLAARRW